MNVLIVDDNVQNLYMLQSLMAGSGYQVETAQNGAVALEKLQKGTFDLVISDILMPQMDGFQLCHQIKQEEKLKDIPLIIYTATYTSPEDESFALSLGADAFIVKPTEPERFLSIVKSLLPERSDAVPLAPPSTDPDDVAEPEPTEAHRLSDTEAEELVDSTAEELDYFRQYNVRLVNKLESKMLQLHEAYRDLETSERLFHTLAETVPVGIFRVASDGMLNYANDQWFDLMGLPKSSADQWLNLVCEADRARTQEAWNRTLRERVPFNTEFRVEMSDGCVKWILGQAKAVPMEDGNAITVVGAFTDITPQKNLEAERAQIQAALSQSQKLEAIGSLVSGISHEFNNFVTAILGFAELARHNLDDAHAACEDIDSLIKAAERAKKLTKQILWFSRKQTEGMQPLQIQTTVREALAMLRGSIPVNVDVIEDFAVNMPPVMADSTQIHQIVLNLITNATHAMKERGGELEIGLKVVEVDSATCVRSPDLHEGKYVRLEIRDTGSGIAAEHRSRIFDPFFTTKAQGEGTGMGLAVVHGIVKRHGGAILVESAVGKGSTFQIFFPAVSTVAVETRPDPSKPTSGHGERILFVDDDESLTSLAERMLQKLGYQPMIATSSNEALAMIAGAPDQVDLVITDMNMPNMGGMELAERIWKLRPGIPIIALTGNQRDFAKEIAIDDRVVDVVFKPFSMGFFADAVARALGSRTATTEH